MHPTLPLLLVRVHMSEPSHAAIATLPPPRRIALFAIPSSAPFVFYVPCADTIADIIRHAVATALSPSSKSYILSEEPFRSHSLQTLLTMVSKERYPSSLGAWKVYANGDVDINPLLDESKHLDKIKKHHLQRSVTVADGIVDLQMKQPVDPNARAQAKRRKIADARFGVSANGDNEKDSIVQSFEVQIEEDYKLPDNSTVVTPNIVLKFDGPNVFKGIRGMIEHDIINWRDMPQWLTGEDGAVEGYVKNGLMYKKGR